jgi:apolipoprotein D and lipocalin family protein
MSVKLLLLVLLLAAAGVCLVPTARADGLPPLQTVARVDLSRYAGVWYEIARYPHRFQKGCLESMASYTLRPDGEMEVVNSCRDEKDGTLRQVKGRAWSVDPIGNARLKVSFFWPFRGDYWVLELGDDYDYAVVGTPSRKYLWILARTPVMDDALYAAILERLQGRGFDPGRLLRAPADAGL